MWKIVNPKLQPTTLNFSSSGQGKFQATKLVADDVEIMNALEFIDWEGEEIQISICDHCGTTHCQSGGWIVFRASGEVILLMPAFEAMLKDNWSRTEYSPPFFIADKGAAYFDIQTYKSLCEQFSSFPSIEKIRPLEMREAMWLVQSSSPLQILGEPATLEMDCRKFDFVIAAMDGDPKEHLQQAEKLLRENFDNHTAVYLRPLIPDEKSVWLFLDESEFIDWQIMVKRNGNYHFVLDNEFIIDDEVNNS